jgi:hypothetical protein
MKKITLTIWVLIIACSIKAQKEDYNWYFGDGAALCFTSGTPVPLNNCALFCSDNSSTVSDTAGNLLFYTNGDTVWNKNHVIMTNGSGLLGSNNSGQCALIVQQPQSDLYYIFTVDQFAGANGFRYSIVDMSLQSGLGEVTTKNVILITPCTEKIDAIYDSSSGSYWILTHAWASASFNCYKLTSTGLNTTPVVSTIGSVNSGGSQYGYNASGQLTFSVNGSTVASGVYDNGTIELFDFDLSTGTLSNVRTITGYSRIWGIAFSPDNSKLYITRWTYDDIIQFDLNAGTISNIMASATVVGQATSTNPNYSAGYLQLGPDNKIYVARFQMNYIGVINDPDSLGNLCSFVNNGVFLGSHTSQAGLSRVACNRMTNSTLSTDIIINNLTCTEHCTASATVTAQGGTLPYSYIWNTTPPQTTQTADSLCSGTYTVTITDGTGNSVTSNVLITNYPTPVVSISVDSSNWTLYCNQTFISYQWYLDGVIIIGATSQTYTPTQNGNYTVFVTDSNGCTATCVKVQVSWLGITEINTVDNTNIFPNPASNILYIKSNLPLNLTITIYDALGRKMEELKNEDNSTSISLNIEGLAKGVYTIQLSGEEKILNFNFVKN